ncbi:MAG: polyphenol oxidase family protein [Elusimicrobia bacterium]|nr:polyphenol oxidase family protein [Elusimicrobiota bacterium]
MIRGEDDLKKNSMGLTEADGIFLAGGPGDAAVCIRTADCIPAFVIHSGELVAAFHAGWRGLAEGITDTLGTLIGEEGLDRRKISVWAGPHICGKCFAVRDDVGSRFPGHVSKDGRLDLFEVMKDRLSRIGIGKDMVRLLRKTGGCTYENGNYYSHRRGDTGRMLVFAIQR